MPEPRPKGAEYRYQTARRLRNLQLTYAEIARHMGVAENTVGVMLRRTREQPGELERLRLENGRLRERIRVLEAKPDA